MGGIGDGVIQGLYLSMIAFLLFFEKESLDSYRQNHILTNNYVIHRRFP